MNRYSFIQACSGCPHTPQLVEYHDWLQLIYQPGTVRNRLYYAHRYLHAEVNCTRALVEFLSNTGLSPSTKKNALDSLRAFNRWRTFMGYPADSSIDLLPTPKIPRGLPRPATDFAVTQALSKATRHIDRLMIMLGCLSGLRSAEIATLHTSNILDTSLRITGKGGHTRYIPIHSALSPELELVPRGWVFPSTKNPTGHMLPASISQRLGDLLGPDWSAHTLRHRFATGVYRNTNDVLALRDLLGHQSLDTTMIYTKVAAGSLAAAVDTLQLPD